MLTSAMLVEFVKEVYARKWVYWYGTCGYKCTQALYNSKRNQYPGHYTAARASGYAKDIAEGRWCADCVGMIKAFFWMNGNIDGPNRYATNHCPDTSADGMIKLCKQTGPISTIPDIPGLVVWKSGHIGVYIGNGYTIEERGFAYDCVKRKVKDGPWTRWGRLPDYMLQYTDQPYTPPHLGDRTLSNGDSGEDVKELQTDLIRLGYDCGRWGADGDFGDATEMAVRDFQKAMDLVVDGEFGPASYSALRLALAALDKPTETPHYVQIVGGNCYVREAPSTTGAIRGVAHEGAKLPYTGETSENGWLKVTYKDEPGWVSGKYGRLVEA